MPPALHTHIQAKFPVSLTHYNIIYAPPLPRAYECIAHSSLTAR